MPIRRPFWLLLVLGGCATATVTPAPGADAVAVADAGLVATVDEVMPFWRPVTARVGPSGPAVLGPLNRGAFVYAERVEGKWRSRTAPRGSLVDDNLVYVDSGGISLWSVVDDQWKQVPGNRRPAPVCDTQPDFPFRARCGGVVADVDGGPRAITGVDDGHWLMVVFDRDDEAQFRFLEFEGGRFSVSAPQRPGGRLWGNGANLAYVVSWRGKRTALFEQTTTNEETLACWEPDSNQPIPLINGQRPPQRNPGHVDGYPPVAQIPQPTCDSRTTETRRLLLFVEDEAPVDASALIGGPQVLVRSSFTGIEPSRPAGSPDQGRWTSILAARGAGDTLQLVISRSYFDGPRTSEEVHFIEGAKTGTSVGPTFIDLTLAP